MRARRQKGHLVSFNSALLNLQQCDRHDFQFPARGAIPVLMCDGNLRFLITPRVSRNSPLFAETILQQPKKRQ